MRNLFLLFIISTLLAGTAQAETIKASVNGLVCAFCATGIEKTFRAQAEVEDVIVDLDNKLVTVKTKKKQSIDDVKLTQLITDAGYSVTAIKREK